MRQTIFIRLRLLRDRLTISVGLDCTLFTAERSATSGIGSEANTEENTMPAHVESAVASRHHDWFEYSAQIAADLAAEMAAIAYPDPNEPPF
jgi:hypothetical protein